MMKKQLITILGCGWLGVPLAKTLAESNNEVLGVTHNSAHQAALTSAKIATSTTLEPIHMSRTHTLIILLPFKRSLEDPRQYFNTVCRHLKQAKESGVARVIWTGSTSIYPKVSGVFDENTPFTLPNERAKVLWDIESAIRDYFPQNGVALRVGGLIGPGRDSSRSLTSGKPIARPLDTIALIHSGDIIALMVRLSEFKGDFRVINVTTGENLSREVYYTAAAKKIGLPLPQFQEQDETTAVCRQIRTKNASDLNWIIKQSADLV